MTSFFQRTLQPLEASHKPDVTVNNLKPTPYPVLPEKRGSTLLRQHPNQASLPRPHQPSLDTTAWQPPAPPPPPRRDNNRFAESTLPGIDGENVPLRGGDLLLDNGTETILVRGDAVRALGPVP